MSNREYTVRAAQLDEAPAILDLWQAARSTHASTPDRIEDANRLLAETPGSLLVADVEGELVGALIAAWDGWRGNMYRLVVLVGGATAIEVEIAPSPAAISMMIGELAKLGYLAKGSGAWACCDVGL